MDNQCLILLSKFSVAARPIVGSVNSAKMLRDSAYASEIFEQVDAVGNEELILLSLDLQNMLGLLAAPPEKPAEQQYVAPKYMFGARG